MFLSVCTCSLLVYACICVHIYMCVCPVCILCVCVYVCVSCVCPVCVCLCVCVCPVCVRVCPVCVLCVCVYACVCVCVCVCVCPGDVVVDKITAEKELRGGRFWWGSTWDRSVCVFFLPILSQTLTQTPHGVRSIIETECTEDFVTSGKFLELYLVCDVQCVCVLWVSRVMNVRRDCNVCA